MERDETKHAVDHYARCVKEYQVAVAALSEARRALAEWDIYPGPPVSPRFHLPEERTGLVYKLEISSLEPFEGYVRTGNYTDGRLGEIFICTAKMGSFISGILDAVATSISVGLQHGVPLSWYVNKFKHTRFEPSGFTKHEEIGQASSVLDYLVRWLDLKYGKKEKDGEPNRQPS